MEFFLEIWKSENGTCHAVSKISILCGTYVKFGIQIGSVWPFRGQSGSICSNSDNGEINLSGSEVEILTSEDPQL